MQFTEHRAHDVIYGLRLIENTKRHQFSSPRTRRSNIQCNQNDRLHIGKVANSDKWRVASSETNSKIKRRIKSISYNILFSFQGINQHYNVGWHL